MAYVKLTEVLKSRGKKAPSTVGQAKKSEPKKSERPRGIKICIGNCSHCAKLKDSVLEAARKLDIPDEEIDIVTDIALLMRIGIITTPALIVNGKLVSIGKVLSAEQAEALLRANGYDK